MVTKTGDAMPMAGRAALRVALIVPTAGALPGAARGAARLAHWLAEDERMVLAAVSHAPSSHASVSHDPVIIDPEVAPSRFAAAMLRLETRLRPGPAPPQLPEAAPDGGNADVVVDLSGDAGRADIGPGAAGQGDAEPRFGTWRLSAFAPLAGFAEVAHGAATIEVSLICRSAGSDRTIGRARYSPKPMAGLNAAFITEKSVMLVQRALAEVHLCGSLPAPLPPVAPTVKADPLRYLSRLGPMLAGRVASRVAERAGMQPGVFAMRLCEGGPFDFDPARGTTLMPPKGQFWADPFLLSHRGSEYLFYEEFHDDVQRGLLKVARLVGDRMEVLGEAITRPHHLSFPFVFEAEGDIWMIPETSRGHRIEIWRATEFPLGWELAATAMEGRAPADTVLAQVDGTWWLFTHFAGDTSRDYCSELHVFRVDGPLLQQIEPHPLNPVVIDSTTARAGGRVWSDGGRLFRASQDNSHGVYGWGLNVMEITRLDMAGYAETRVRHVTPGFEAGIIGCHHMDFAGNRVVIDLRYRTARAARGV